MNMTLFTSGYQGETVTSFIRKLMGEHIRAVIDIRQKPFSRKPGFSKNSLDGFLKESGIKYYHFQELGTPEPLRNFLAQGGSYNIFFRQYKSFLPEYRDSLDDIVDIGSQQKVCIMCFEKNPHSCHRKVVVELLKEYAGKDIEVVHL